MRSVLLLMLFLSTTLSATGTKAQQGYAVQYKQTTAYDVPSIGDQASKKAHKKKSAKKISQQQAAQKVKSRYGGKILKVQNSKVAGNAGYKVKLLKEDGHIISVLVDGQSGKIKGN